MPKLKPSEQEQQNMNTRAVIAYCQERTGVTDEELAKLLSRSTRTVQRKKVAPETMHLSDLRILVKALKMTNEQKAELIGL